MNDEETVALIAGGHTFGKTHGAGRIRRMSGPSRKRAGLEDQGLGLEEQLRHRQGRRHDHQRPGGHLDHHADEVEQRLLREPVRLRVGADQEPGRRQSVEAEGRRRRGHRARMPHDASKRIAPSMLTTDLALRFDPAYEKISRRFLEHPDQFADAFARAWFKLTHRDMGPRARYLGPEVPAEELIWQDPIPAVDHKLIDEKDVASLKGKILASGPVGFGTGFDRMGVGVHLPRFRQARRRQRRAHPPCAAEGLGGESARPAGEGAEDSRRHPERVQQRRSPAARRFRWPT